MQKKGQTTLFIILGVVIVIIIGLYALVGYGIINKKFIYSQQINDKQNDVDEYIRECIRNVIKEKLKTIGIENIDFNSLEEDEDILKCFELNEVKENFEIITVDNPKINVSYLDDNLEFGIIYPLTISKGGVNVSLYEYNFVQSLKSCGVDYNSVDERLNIRSNEETCVTISRISSNTLAPVYEIKTLESFNNIQPTIPSQTLPSQTTTIKEITISFGALTKDSVIVEQINEAQFIAVDSEKSSITNPLNAIEKSSIGITKQEKKEVIKAVVTSGNFTLIEKTAPGRLVNIRTQNPILPIDIYIKPITSETIIPAIQTPIIATPTQPIQQIQLKQFRCSKIKETGCVWIFDDECSEYSRGEAIGSCGLLNRKTIYNCYEDKLTSCSLEAKCDEDEIISEEIDCKLEEEVVPTTPTTPATTQPITPTTPTQPTPGILVASTFDEERDIQGDMVYLYYHVKLENKGGSAITIKNFKKCYTVSGNCDPLELGQFGGRIIQPGQSITTTTKAFIWTYEDFWSSTGTFYSEDSLNNNLEASYSVSVSK
ncbi:hypothetical protein HYX17_00525 [Candidatus Woesearchaeota archaeon]|nr:hypothetical protein [Candidatus Woesearchaeota archaeon]